MICGDSNREEETSASDRVGTGVSSQQRDEVTTRNRI